MSKVHIFTSTEIKSGAPCFAGTRVTARTLFDYLEGSDSLEDFPTLIRAIGVIRGSIRLNCSGSRGVPLGKSAI